MRTGIAILMGLSCLFYAFLMDVTADIRAITTRPAGNIAVLDGTPQHVTIRQQCFIRYGGAGAQINLKDDLEWAASLPKNSFVLFDYEPILSMTDAITLTQAIKGARPDEQIGWYGLIDVNPWGTDRVVNAMAALLKPEDQRTDQENWYVASLNEGLKWVQDSREQSERCRQLIGVSSYVPIRIYPPTGVGADWIRNEIKAEADEAWRMGQGKPVVLLVSGRIEDFSKDWTLDLLGEVRTDSIANNIKTDVIWDTGINRKQAEFIATEIAKRK